jgi:C-lobe and N-lobe beta barrels of Tf-binding protein B
MASFTSSHAATRRITALCSLSILTLLGGCGGGGGDGPVASIKPAPPAAKPVTPATKPVQVAEAPVPVVPVPTPVPVVDATVPLEAPAMATTVNLATGAQGETEGGLFISIPDATAIKIGDRSPVGGNGVTFGSNSPNTQTLTIVGEMATGTAIPSANGLTETSVTPQIAEFDESSITEGDKSLLLLRVASQTDGNVLLKSSAYGLYIAGKPAAAGSGFTLGYVFGGIPTENTDMPQNVTATYDGMFAGNGFAVDGTAGQGKSGYSRALVGDVALTFDAAAGTVKGNVYNMMGNDTTTDAPQSPESFGLAIDAKVDATTGNTYQGAVNFTNASNVAGAAAVAGATQSNVIGGFYGPQAAETAGALQVQGKAPGAGLPKDLFVSGGYGAIKR